MVKFTIMFKQFSHILARIPFNVFVWRCFKPFRIFNQNTLHPHLNVFRCSKQLIQRGKLRIHQETRSQVVMLVQTHMWSIPHVSTTIIYSTYNVFSSDTVIANITAYDVILSLEPLRPEYDSYLIIQMVNRSFQQILLHRNIDAEGDILNLPGSPVRYVMVKCWHPITHNARGLCLRIVLLDKACLLVCIMNGYIENFKYMVDVICVIKDGRYWSSITQFLFYLDLNFNYLKTMSTIVQPKSVKPSDFQKW